jgi:hypothetical protein
MKKQGLSPEQAFKAMTVFLERYYERGDKTGDLALVVGELQINPQDGAPMDPAAWRDWLAAVDAALHAPEPAIRDAVKTIPQQRKQR